MAVGVINQLEIQKEQFEVVLIGSLHGCSPIMDQALRRIVRKTAPLANSSG